MIKLIDTHAHLDQVENIEQALSQAQAAGVEAIVAVGIDHNSNVKNLQIKKKAQQSEQQPKIFVALGIHPESLKDAGLQDVKEPLNFIKENLNNAVAVGEIGLDFWYSWAKKSDEKKKLQKDVFQAQLNLAKESGKPVVIHSRGAWRECLDLAKDAGVKRAVFHWYSGPLDVLDEILTCGYLISATPALGLSPQHREAIGHARIEDLLIETDCPVFYREGEGGFRSTPKDVFKTLKFYGQLKNISEEKAAGIFCENSRKFFDIS
ncbi:MAG TPA: TatD family hydrolase [Candidatus Omnitrophota bacterium]|nr:TatD family hydrolase [Candidatus Omnitrophota bacterium]HPD83865.1 TatD family hydrolase [Candidatus Omnitrophota bacterium]HRZ02722.1 TatD family hydrolase [Candidatus Omnitrophota bacterium]